MSYSSRPILLIIDGKLCSSIAAAVDLYKCRKQQSQQTDTISRIPLHLRCSVVNMSKSCCFAVMLAVICLSVILLSFVADAQPKKIKNEIKDEIREVKKMIESGREYMDRKLEDVVQQLVKDIKDGTKEVNRLLTSNQNVAPQSKEAFVTALVCEYLVCW